MTPKTLCILALAALAGGLALAAAPAPSVAELLEKGIYKEETAGDLAAAIHIYEQIVADATASRSAMAQAHYRLAMCQLKQGDTTRALETYHALKDKFPEEKELIARAQEHMPGGVRLEPAPWVDGEVLKLDIKLPGGVPIGAVVLIADSAVVDGRELWKLELRRYVATMDNNQGLSRVEVDRETFRPVRSSFRHGMLGAATTTYGEGWAEVTTEQEGGEPAKRRIECDSQIFDNEQAMHLLRRLPLEVGYKTALKAFTFTGQSVPFTVDVKQKETVTVPAGTFEAYKVELSIGQTFWFSTDRNRYLVRFEAGGTVAELSRIGRRGETAPSVIEDPALGYTLKLPADWFGLAHSIPGRADFAMVSLFDPAATASGVLELKKLVGEERPSLAEIGKREIEGARQRFTEYALREDSWSERPGEGRSVLSFLGDFKKDDERWVQYRAYVLGQDLRAEFIISFPAERLESYRPALEAMLAGYREN